MKKNAIWSILIIVKEKKECYNWAMPKYKGAITIWEIIRVKNAERRRKKAFEIIKRRYGQTVQKVLGLATGSTPVTFI